MKKNITTLVLLLLINLTTMNIYSEQSNVRLENNGGATQLMVGGKPYLMIAGELHNSSSSTVPYINSIWPRLEAMNLNTVLAAVAWEQFEPEEGKHDYTIIDHLIKKSEESDMKLIVLWFASWKNGQSSYAPMWVKTDTKRFPRVKNKNGDDVETLSMFGSELLSADLAAYKALVKRIKKVDKNNTVIMMQPQNEVGLFQEIDYLPEALAAYDDDVPETLINYLKSKENKLNPYILKHWNTAGKKNSGTWGEVFGNNPASKEFFMAWNYASFINELAKEGKEILSVPVFVNAWIVQQADDLPGVYPNGGPVARVIDIYKAAAPYIDIQAPDIYLHNYKEILAKYHRDDNPLMIPESLWNEPSRAFYAFAHHDALLFAPFGIDNPARGDDAFSAAYAVLHELSPLILEHQGKGSMIGLRREGDEKTETFELGKYRIKVEYQTDSMPAYGLIIQTDEHEFVVSGINFRAKFTALDTSYTGYIGQVWEGGYHNGKWVPTRQFNGDETFHNELLRVFGRETRYSKSVTTGQLVPPQPNSNGSDELTGEILSVPTPAIYKVTTYIR